MDEDTSKTPAGNELDADSGEQSPADKEQGEIARDKEIGGRGGLLRVMAIGKRAADASTFDVVSW